MKKVGIITIVKVNNYGAELQAFALQKKLELMGYQSEIIDYLYYKNWQFKDTVESRPFVLISKKEKVAYWIKYRLINFLIDKLLPVLNNTVRNRQNRFYEFHRLHTKFSKTFYSFPELYQAKLGYDVYIAGSDQIWNPTTLSSIEPYFLTFAPKEARKISYASSFGVSHITDELQNRYKQLLNNIKVISVRESNGVDIVKRLVGREAKQVADPTLLLSKDEWKLYMKSYPNMPVRYVLIYQLSDSDAIVKLARKIGKEQQIPIYRICKRAIYTKKDTGIINIADAGPAEFISLIANAEYVVTNSFHGTAFSVNFSTPFYTVVSFVKKNNSRMESLLTLVGLKNRLLSDDTDLESVNIGIPDFEEVQSKLQQVREQSIAFLRDNI